MINGQVELSKICDVNWVKSKTLPTTPKIYDKELKIIDLFCGCGGLTLGAWEWCRLNKTKLTIKLAVDSSEDAINVYKQNFHLQKDNVVLSDINMIFPGSLGNNPTKNEKELKNKIGNIDLLLAGPPCQGNSDLNNHSRRNDPRNSLYLKAIRAIEVLLPETAIIENVPAVIHNKEKSVETSKNHLLNLGYFVSDTIIDVSKLGIPQKRKRHILMATKNKEINISKYIASIEDDIVPISQYISDLESEHELNNSLFNTPSKMKSCNKQRVEYLFNNNVYNLPNDLRPDCHKNKVHSYISMYGRMQWHKPAQTITSGFGSMGQGRFVHPRKKRTITPHEAARIQGFPDFYDFSLIKKRTILHEIIGNAVPPKITAVLIDAFISI